MAYTKINEIKQFDFQINRTALKEGLTCDFNKVKQATKNIKTLDEWYEAWLPLAKKAEEESRYMHAATAYRMAEFFLTASDLRTKMYDKSIENYYKAFDELKIPYIINDISYKGTKMHTMIVGDPKNPKKIVVTGGYDSLLEEFLLMVFDFYENGYTLVLYEGDGQGKTLNNGLALTHAWEEPTSAVYDFYNLNNVPLIGISWGGYFVMRAAAFDKRISGVACWNVLNKGLDIILSFAPAILKNAFEEGKVELVNTKLNEIRKENLLLNWAITQGEYITKTNSPFDFLTKISKHTLDGITDKITQHVLLTAGEKDHYIPKSHFEELATNLPNVKSLRKRLFTTEEGGQEHCQVGNMKIATDEILDWIKTIS